MGRVLMRVLVKIVGVLLSLVILLFIAGGIFTHFFLDDFVKGKIEKLASKQTGLTVKIAQLDISLLEKSVRLEGVRVGNLQGYKNPFIFELGAIETRLKTLPLAGKPLHISSIGVEGVGFFVEIVDKKINVLELKERLVGEKTASDNLPDDDNPKPETPVLIDKIDVGEASLRLEIDFLADRVETVTLPAFVLTDINSAGEPGRDILNQLLDLYLTRLEERLKARGYFKTIEEHIRDELDKVKAEAEAELKAKLGQEKEKVKKEIKEKIEGELKDSLKKLF